ncbi:MAG: sensor histidine kinase [Bacteriovorax sp.]
MNSPSHYSKEQLLLDLSHELCSPITRIKVALELDNEKSKDYIRKNINDLEAVISILLESARLDNAESDLSVKRTDITQLIFDVMKKYENINPGIHFCVNSKKKTMLNIDSNRIEMVLKNIFENALKFSSFQKRPVEISVEGEDDGATHIHVRDFGCGIAQEEMGLIFEPFYRVDKSRSRDSGGHGLGLSLCKKIMDAHRGEIRVSHSSEQGTLFTLIFNPSVRDERITRKRL